MFTSTYNHGFQMTFDSGLVISVQFGKGNYCTRKSGKTDLNEDLEKSTVSSRTAEIAIWDSSQNDYNFRSHTDIYNGWCSTSEVAKWIHAVSQAKSLEDIDSYTADIK